MTIDPLLDVGEFSELRRVAVIDVGSNSVRLVVFNGAARSPAYFFNEKVLCGLGKGIADTGMLNPEGRQRALRALERFKAVTDQMQVQSLSTVATAAVREAKDGPAFCAEVLERTGIEISVATGDEEARLSAQGVLLGWPSANGLVCDIGGASMELAEVSDGKVGNRCTSPLGPLKLATGVTNEAKLDTKISSEIGALRRQISGDYKQLFLVGGSFRAIAKVDMTLKSYPLDVLHEYTVETKDLLGTLDWILTSSQDKVENLTSTSLERMRLVPIAARVLKSLVTTYTPEVIAVSSYGLREGLLFERMPDPLKSRDPLIEACRWMERDAARFPGFGEALTHWVLQVLPDTDADLERLVRAACLLHDVSWRAHPNFRAEVSFDSATRSNLGGLDHKGRVFLAMALLHRYKNSAKSGRYQKLGAILTEEQQKIAVITGRAMRLGASLASGAERVLEHSSLTTTDTELVLSVPDSMAPFDGEAVAQRLKALASAMGLSAVGSRS